HPAMRPGTTWRLTKVPPHAPGSPIEKSAMFRQTSRAFVAWPHPASQLSYRRYKRDGLISNLQFPTPNLQYTICTTHHASRNCLKLRHYRNDVAAKLFKGADLVHVRHVEDYTLHAQIGQVWTCLNY